MLSAHGEPAFTIPHQEARRGLVVAVATVALTALTFGIAILTPPLSGPWCTDGCFAYPYAEIGDRFPRDYYWMFSAMALSVVLVALFACVHRAASPRTQTFSLVALALGTSAAVILLVDYYVQIAVIQPSVLHDERDGIALLSQFNPRGVFIALEEVGFALSSVALACLAPVFWRTGRIGRAISWTFLVSAALGVVSLVAITAVHGVEREYRFEIAIITVVWLELIVGGGLLAAFYSRAMRAR